MLQGTDGNNRYSCFFQFLNILKLEKASEFINSEYHIFFKMHIQSIVSRTLTKPDPRGLVESFALDVSKVNVKSITLLQ